MAVKSYLLILGNLILGLLIVIGFNKLHSTTWLNRSFLILLVFIFINLGYLCTLKLKTEFREFWTLRKLKYMPIGMIGGSLIAFIPIIIALAAGDINFCEITLRPDIHAYSVAITFLIISWEELWFRGLFLNYCNRCLSAITISLTMGILFMSVHALNPEMDLLKTAPNLFFAGVLLTILYFYYRTFWLPLGLHFGNNFIGSIIGTRLENHALFGNEGYIGTLVLAGLCALFIKLTMDKGRA